MSAETQAGELVGLDRVVEELHRLRTEAGHPSYADIARGISLARRDREFREDRVGTTTVYDAFRYGRRRMDDRLVTDIAGVLNATEVEVAELRRLLKQGLRSAPAPPRGAPASTAPMVATGAPEHAAPPIPLTPLFVGGVMIASLAVNMAGNWFTNLLHMSLYLDMIGTAITAVVLGPWHGAAVGLATNGFEAISDGPYAIPFGLVNIAGALAWGYGVNLFRMGRTIPRFFVLSVTAGVLCSMVAAPIIIILFGGNSPGPNGSATLAARLNQLGTAAPFSMFVSNLWNSVCDKVVSGFIALAVAEALPGYSLLKRSSR